MRITRSTGRVLGIVGVAGGGYLGLTPELDDTVTAAAGRLAEAYGIDVEIRFNSGRESGGAWLCTPDGGNAEVGIAASVVTAEARRAWERFAQRDEAWAASPDNPTAAGRAEAAETVAYWRTALANSPEGQLTVCAHITAAVVAPHLRAELAALPGWNPMTRSAGGGYHHGPADSVSAALTRCLRFRPA